jgi:hypothetical protein
MKECARTGDVAVRALQGIEELTASRGPRAIVGVQASRKGLTQSRLAGCITLQVKVACFDAIGVKKV